MTQREEIKEAIHATAKKLTKESGYRVWFADLEVELCEDKIKLITTSPFKINVISVFEQEFTQAAESILGYTPDIEYKSIE